jgi:hypothetical protein
MEDMGFGLAVQIGEDGGSVTKLYGESVWGKIAKKELSSVI